MRGRRALIVVVAVAVAMTLALALVGCGEEPTVEGSWTDQDGVVYEFDADGSARIVDAAMDTSATGTWETGDDTLTLEFDDAGKVTVDIVTLTAEELVIEDSDGARYTLEK
jgi:hypothetical protein